MVANESLSEVKENPGWGFCDSVNRFGFFELL